MISKNCFSHLYSCCISQPSKQSSLCVPNCGKAVKFLGSPQILGIVMKRCWVTIYRDYCVLLYGFVGTAGSADHQQYPPHSSAFQEWRRGGGCPYFPWFGLQNLNPEYVFTLRIFMKSRREKMPLVNFTFKCQALKCVSKNINWWTQSLLSWKGCGQVPVGALRDIFLKQLLLSQTESYVSQNRKKRFNIIAVQSTGFILLGVLHSLLKGPNLFIPRVMLRRRDFDPYLWIL